MKNVASIRRFYVFSILMAMLCARASAGNQCGPKALYHCMNMHGMQVEYPRVLNSIPLTEEGCSIFDIVVAAESMGLEANAVQMNYGSLTSQKSPLILYLEEGHFILVSPSIRKSDGKDQYFRMIDESHQPTWISSQDLKSRWGGKAILLGDKIHGEGLAESEYPRLELKSYFYDLSDINTNQIIKISIPFKNSGTEPLDILDIQKSCGCTTASCSRMRYQAGEEGQIDLSFNTYGKLGHQSLTTTIMTNDPLSPSHTVTVYGYITSDRIVTPARIDVDPAEIHDYLTLDFDIQTGQSLPFKIESWMLANASLDSTPIAKGRDAMIQKVDVDKDKYMVSLRVQNANQFEVNSKVNLILNCNRPEGESVVIPVRFISKKLNVESINVNFGIVKTSNRYSESIQLKDLPVSSDFEIEIHSAEDRVEDIFAIPKLEYDPQHSMLTLSVAPKRLHNDFADLVEGSVKYRSVQDQEIVINWKYLNVM